MIAEDVSYRRLLDHLRRNGGASVAELTELLAVTATAVRQRLNRLMAEGLIEREQSTEEKQPSRGRPSYTYRLTEKGRRDSGDNYDDLAQAMWEEIRSISDPAVRVGLLKRLASKLAERYADRVDGEGVVDRMRRLIQVMGEREVPVEVEESNGLPVLTMLACPYPTLAEQDRTICALEKLMLSEVLGQDVRLSDYRLDGDTCCTFRPSKSSADETKHKKTDTRPPVANSNAL